MTRGSGLGAFALWGSVTALLYWMLFDRSGSFERLAHTTVDSCAVREQGETSYYRDATPQLCANRGGTYAEGTWWYIFAPIALALVLSVTHGIATGRFWDLMGLKAKQ